MYMYMSVKADMNCRKNISLFDFFIFIFLDVPTKDLLVDIHDSLPTKLVVR